MVLKIKPGTTVVVNGKRYIVKTVESEQVGRNAESDIKIIAEYDLDRVEISFDNMTLGVSEYDLQALIQMLTTG